MQRAAEEKNLAPSENRGFLVGRRWKQTVFFSTIPGS